MSLGDLLNIIQQIFIPFAPLLALVFVVVCLLLGIFFAMVILFLRRV